MPFMNLAQRVHDNNYEFDPIVRSLMDTDFYKLLMAQFIYKNYKDVNVTFKVTVRSKDMNLFGHITIDDLYRQTEFVRNLKLTKNEELYLRGNTFYGITSIFTNDFINAFKNIKLPPVIIHNDKENVEITVTGNWLDVTMWEIYLLSIINELYYRSKMKHMSKFELDIMYSRAKTKLWNKLQHLQKYPDLKIADFGTRRRHSYLWQEWVVFATKESLGNSFVGTSNVAIAMKSDLEAIGTNAHELPMVISALSNDSEEIKYSQYKILQQWQETYSGSLLMMLPDTFGTTQFLNNAPEWTNNWTGIRVDSKDPIIAGDEIIKHWIHRGQDPMKKKTLFSDGLDYQDIIKLHTYFQGKTLDGYGWGTMLTNDFDGCHPHITSFLKPYSIVCKVHSVNGVSAVKLSDNALKVTGEPSRVAMFRNIFGSDGVENIDIKV